MELKIISSLAETSAEEWNRLRQPNFPFTRYEHLLALETTHCLGERTGWFPTYLLAQNSSGQTVGATWFYEKNNSYGEFVFDAEWGEIHERLGIAYYPKSVTSIPFTPATGAKIFGESEGIRGELAAAAAALSRKYRLSSHHHLFIPGADRAEFESKGYAIRTGVQFHWRNQGYADFEDFLGALKKKRRKEVRYERRSVDEDLEIRLLQDEQLNSRWADFAYDLYQKTNVEKMSFVCLTRGYFEEVFAKMKSAVRFFVACKKGTDQPVAGALFLTEGPALFGRYWGSIEERRYLHFELCYYSPIEYAINEGIQLFEAGAQGSHKISRGFLPTITLSAHHFFNTQIHDAFVRYCTSEKNQILSGIENYSEHFPFAEGNLIVDAGL